MKQTMHSTHLQEAIYANGYSMLIPHAKSTGFQLNATRMQAIHHKGTIAEDFLVSLGFEKNQLEAEHSIFSYLLPSGTALISQCAQEDNQHLQKVKLPPSIPLNMSLDRALTKRRSIRHYTGDALPLDYLATLLRLSSGITHQADITQDDNSTTTISKRSVASAGGLYPIDIYVATLNVKGLAKGIYQFNPREDKLIQLFNEKVAAETLSTFSITEEQISLSRACFIIFMVGSAHKSIYKYGTNGLAFTLQEVGSIAQTIHLSATALGICTIDCASYYRKALHRLLKLDGLYKHVFHAIVGGIH